MNELDYDEAVRFLENIPQFSEENPDYIYGIQRAEVLLKHLGNPQKDLKIVHVAGTNGKGSVCAYLSSCLESVGITTGLFTSPHLTDIRERVRLSGEMISKKDFTRLFNVVRKEAKSLPFESAYFEYFLAIALLYYNERHADCVILETGLGGRLDATNAVAEKVLSVITGIGLEHTDILGDSLNKIATEKAGIIVPGVPVVVSCDDGDILKIFQKVAEENGSRLIYADYRDLAGVVVTPENVDFSIENEYYKNVSFTVPVPAVYEAVNGKTALTAAAVLKESAVFKNWSGHVTADDTENFRQALRETVWEGRMERISGDIYVDGAHNPQSVDAFLKSVRAFASGKKNILLFSVVSDKNYEEMIKQITESDLFAEYIITMTATQRSLSKDKLAEVFKRYTDAPVEAFDNVNDAFLHARKKEKDYLFCAGSLYLAGEIKKLEGTK